MLEEAAEKNEAVVWFGNQVVPKGTPEYDVRREKNREAVKKSREKKAQENLERDKKMPELHKENDTLKANLDSLVKEINEIKGNILLLNRGRNLPEDISKLFQQFENECKDGWNFNLITFFYYYRLQTIMSVIFYLKTNSLYDMDHI